MERVKSYAILIVVSLMLTCLLSQGYADSQKVNINTDSKEILMTLKGVGDKIAERIIEYRKAHPFEQPADIMNVKGVGQKVFEDNKERIVVKNE